MVMDVGAGTRTLAPGADARAVNADSVTPVPPPVSAAPTNQTLLYAGWVTGLTAGIVSFAINIVAGWFGVDFHLGIPGTDLTWTLSSLQNLLIPWVVGLGAALIAMLLLGRRRARRMAWLLGTIALGIAVTLPALWTPTVTWSTRVTALVMQLLTYGLIVPQFARILGDSEPHVLAGYRDATV